MRPLRTNKALYKDYTCRAGSVWRFHSTLKKEILISGDEIFCLNLGSAGEAGIESTFGYQMALGNSVAHRVLGFV